MICVKSMFLFQFVTRGQCLIENHLAVFDEIIVVLLHIVLQPKDVNRQKRPERRQNHVYPARRMEVGTRADRHSVAIMCRGHIYLEHHLRDSFLETNNVVGVGLV